MHRAKRLGTPEHLGWGPAEYQLARLDERMQVAAIATLKAAGDKRSRKVEPAYRPTVRTEPRTLGDVQRQLMQMD